MTPIELGHGNFTLVLNRRRRGLTPATHLASYGLGKRNTVGFGRYPCCPRGTKDMQRRDGAHELSLVIVDSPKTYKCVAGVQ